MSLMTTRQAALEAGCSIRVIRRACDSGELESVRNHRPRSWRFVLPMWFAIWLKARNEQKETKKERAM